MNPKAQNHYLNLFLSQEIIGLRPTYMDEGLLTFTWIILSHIVINHAKLMYVIWILFAHNDNFSFSVPLQSLKFPQKIKVDSFYHFNISITLGFTRSINVGI